MSFAIALLLKIMTLKDCKGTLKFAILLKRAFLCETAGKQLTRPPSPPMQEFFPSDVPHGFKRHSRETLQRRQDVVVC